MVSSKEARATFQKASYEFCNQQDQERVIPQDTAKDHRLLLEGLHLLQTLAV